MTDFDTMMEKTFDPARIEARWSAEWEKAGAFRAGRVAAEPFTIVIPPPNVTGSLHMGHALNNTLQDILCRYWRMKGRDVLWQPGTDHAGIATQMVVERQMMERQEPNRHAIGREKFLDKVWAWKEESGGTIINQLKRLGASCDWDRGRFTMGNREDGEKGQMQRAVLQFFVTLHEKGLLYKAKRLVNWDPKLLTAISDLEVEQKEVKGSYAWARASRSPDEPNARADEHRPERGQETNSPEVIGQEKPGEVDKEGNPKAFSSEALGKLLAKEPGGHLYYFDYPIEGETYDPASPSTFIRVATTRPETMLGDTAVAVHPENERLKPLIGRHAVLPLVGCLIPIIADEYADPEKGTGAVKITPAHDFNDFEVGKRHNLPLINMLDREGAVDLSEAAFANIPAETRALHGLPRFTARLKVVEMMEAAGFLAKIEPHGQQVPHGDRSGVPIEPWLTEQWYVNVKPLAEQAMAWVRAGKTRIMPANREADFFRWLENIEPWCVSRQLWWGHQIPAWYGPDGDYVIAISEAEALSKYSERAKKPAQIVPFEQANKYFQEYMSAAQVRKHLASKTETEHRAFHGDQYWIELLRLAEADTFLPITRDPDVLDTWFSSALWPFSTMGWPDSTPELARYYPGSALVTGFDILFFWVARMMMASAATDQAPPFRDVYLHGLVRDEKGRKMSKSVGNVIDPLVVIDALGADALRFTLASLAAQGRDPKLGVKTAEGYRNFCTKLWNASRFAEMNECRAVAGFDPGSVTLPLNRWIMAEADKALAEIEAGIEGYKFNEAALAAYRFTWNIVCDWYLELAKPVLQGEDGAPKDETRAAVAFVLDRTVAMLHPFMPFITEELNAAYGELAGVTRGQLCTGSWPKPIGLSDASAEAEIGFTVDLISEIRSARAEMNVPVATTAPLVFVNADAAGVTRAKAAEDALRRMARVSEIQFMHEAPAQSVQILVRGQVACIPLAGIIDIAAEKKRLSGEREKLVKDMDGTRRKLDNPDFVARAPEEVIEENRERLAEAENRIARIDEALKRLG
ncbi:MAG: valine--tRNA ligase [Methylobacterium sp.]|nr:MAG: valine--tRNA ligase [Methylobacterium sp.]